MTNDKRSAAVAALQLAAGLLQFATETGHQGAGRAVYPTMRNYGLWTGNPNSWGTKTGQIMLDPMTPETLRRERDVLIKLIAAGALLDNDFITVDHLSGGIDIFRRPPWERLKKMNEPDYDPIKVFLLEWETLGLTAEEAYDRVQERLKSFRFGFVNVQYT